jgi:hypothetical protein
MILKPDFDLLPQLALAAGILTAAPAVFALAAPAAAEKIFKKLPRSVWTGRIVSAACLAWVALWLIVMPLGMFSVLRDAMWLLLPLSIAAVWIFIPDLLACRAIGGFLALAPAPLLSAAQWHPSPFRYVVLVYAYALAIAGMHYIALPYLLRDHIAWAFAKPLRARVVAGAFAALGLFLAALSLAAFRV